MKLPTSSYFLIAIIGIMSTVIGVSLTFPSQYAKLFPIIICGLILVLAAAELTRENLAGKGNTKRAEAEPVKEEMKPGVASRRSLLIAAWMLGFLLMLYLLGMTVGIPLFVLAYLKSTGRGWLISFGIAALMTAFTYFTFGVLLGIDLYRGLFFGGTW